MTISTDTYKVALRYVTAFLDIAEEKKAMKKVETDLSTLDSLIRSSEDFLRFINSPILSRQQKLSVAQTLAKKIKLDTLTTNFLMLLAQNRRLSILPSVVTLAFEEIAQRSGQVSAFVQTAHVLSAKQTKDLVTALEKTLNKDVAISVEEDKSLIGGVTIRTGSLMIDDSVKTKISKLNRQLKTGTQ